MFAAWFDSIFKVQNVLTSHDYTAQIIGKVAESAELAFAVVSRSAGSLNVHISALWSNKVSGWLNNRMCYVGFMCTHLIWFPYRLILSHHQYPLRSHWVLMTFTVCYTDRWGSFRVKKLVFFFKGNSAATLKDDDGNLIKLHFDISWMLMWFFSWI